MVQPMQRVVRCDGSGQVPGGFTERQQDVVRALNPGQPFALQFDGTGKRLFRRELFQFTGLQRNRGPPPDSSLSGCDGASFQHTSHESRVTFGGQQDVVEKERVRNIA